MFFLNISISKYPLEFISIIVHVNEAGALAEILSHYSQFIKLFFSLAPATLPWARAAGLAPASPWTFKPSYWSNTIQHTADEEELFKFCDRVSVLSRSPAVNNGHGGLGDSVTGDGGGGPGQSQLVDTRRRGWVGARSNSQRCWGRGGEGLVHH